MADHLSSSSLNGMSKILCLQLVLLISVFTDSGNTAGINITCPEQFKDGDVNTITCVVDKDAITRANCQYPASVVNFKVERSTPKECAIQQYDNPSACAALSASQSCGCTNALGNVFTFQFKYDAQKSLDEGRKVTCSIDCDSPTTPVTSTSLRCDRISYGSGNCMHVLRNGIVASVIGVIVLITTHLG